MLAADKLLLQSSIRQNTASLREKEFLLHHDNLTTVGTQAAVMAGYVHIYENVTRPTMTCRGGALVCPASIGSGLV